LNLVIERVSKQYRGGHRALNNFSLTIRTVEAAQETGCPAHARRTRTAAFAHERNATQRLRPDSAPPPQTASPLCRSGPRRTPPVASRTSMVVVYSRRRVVRRLPIRTANRRPLRHRPRRVAPACPLMVAARDARGAVLDAGPHLLRPALLSAAALVLMDSGPTARHAHRWWTWPPFDSCARHRKFIRLGCCCALHSGPRARTGSLHQKPQTLRSPLHRVVVHRAAPSAPQLGLHRNSARVEHSGPLPRSFDGDVVCGLLLADSAAISRATHNPLDLTARDNFFVRVWQGGRN
jgi:hypothetical protein